MDDDLENFMNNILGKSEDGWISRSINVLIDFSFKVESDINNDLRIEVYIDENKLRQDLNTYIEKYIKEEKE